MTDNSTKYSKHKHKIGSGVILFLAALYLIGTFFEFSQFESGKQSQIETWAIFIDFYDVFGLYGFLILSIILFISGTTMIINALRELKRIKHQLSQTEFDDLQFLHAQQSHLEKFKTTKLPKRFLTKDAYLKHRKLKNFQRIFYILIVGLILAATIILFNLPTK